MGKLVGGSTLDWLLEKWLDLMLVRSCYTSMTIVQWAVCSLGFRHSRHRGSEGVVVDTPALSLLACIAFALVQWNRNTFLWIRLVEGLKRFIVEGFCLCKGRNILSSACFYLCGIKEA